MQKKAVIIELNDQVSNLLSDSIKISKALKDSQFEILQLSITKSNISQLLLNIESFLGTIHYQDTLICYLFIPKFFTELPLKSNKFTTDEILNLVTVFKKCIATNKMIFIDSYRSNEMLSKIKFNMFVSLVVLSNSEGIANQTASFLTSSFVKALSNEIPETLNRLKQLTPNSFFDYLNSKLSTSNSQNNPQVYFSNPNKKEFEITNFNKLEILNLDYNIEYSKKRIEFIKKQVASFSSRFSQQLISKIENNEKKLKNLNEELEVLRHTQLLEMDPVKKIQYQRRIDNYESQIDVVLLAIDSIETDLANLERKPSQSSERLDKENAVQPKIFINHFLNSKTSHLLINKLSVLRDINLCKVWSSNDILVGEKYKKRLHDELIISNIVLLWLEDDYINNKLNFRLEEEAISKEKIVVPILYSDCIYDVLPFYKYGINVLPKGTAPIEDQERPNSVLTDIVRQIRELFKTL